MYIHIHTDKFVNTYINIYMHTHKYKCTCMHVWQEPRAILHVYESFVVGLLYKYIYTYIYIYIYIYMYIYIYTSKFRMLYFKTDATCILNSICRYCAHIYIHIFICIYTYIRRNVACYILKQMQQYTKCMWLFLRECVGEF